MGGGVPTWLQYYIGGEGSLRTPKSDYVICARPLIDNTNLPLRLTDWTFSHRYKESRGRTKNSLKHLNWHSKYWGLLWLWGGVMIKIMMTMVMMKEKQYHMSEAGSVPDGTMLLPQCWLVQTTQWWFLIPWWARWWWWWWWRSWRWYWLWELTVKTIFETSFGIPPGNDFNFRKWRGGQLHNKIEKIKL